MGLICMQSMSFLQPKYMYVFKLNSRRLFNLEMTRSRLLYIMLAFFNFRAFSIPKACCNIACNLYCAQHFSQDVATHCNISRNICWLFPIKQDIEKLAKPKTSKYVEEELWFLVFSFRLTVKFVARNLAEVERDSTSEILRAILSGVDTGCNLTIACGRCCTVPCVQALRQKH